MTQEKQRRAVWRLRHKMGEVQIGLIHVEVNIITSKDDITNKKDVEDTCHDDNRRKFSQTSNAPLVH